MAVVEEVHTSGMTPDGVFIAPGQVGSLVQVRPRDDNFIGGRWVPPTKGQYMQNLSPVTGHAFTEVARSSAEDVELALDAATRPRTPGARRRSPSGPPCSTRWPTPSKPI